MRRGREIHVPAEPQVIPLLWRAQQTIEQRLLWALEHHGHDDVSLTDARLLWHVREGPRFLDHLRESLGQSRQAIWRRARSLEARGYATVERHERWGRLQIAVTAKADSITALVEEEFGMVLGDLADALPDGGYEAFKLALAVLADDPLVADVPQLWAAYRDRPLW